MANKNQDKLELGFPVYAVAYSEATSVLYVAGGGGPAKSGVRNCLVPDKDRDGVNLDPHRRYHTSIASKNMN